MSGVVESGKGGGKGGGIKGEGRSGEKGCVNVRITLVLGMLISFFSRNRFSF